MATIYWAGDSTVQYNDITTYPQTGIGQVFHLFLKPEVKVLNFAKNGRSTKSFIDEGRLAAIEEQITEGDFLFIQFGHNDEKKADPVRYTDPFGQYMVNLERFVNVAREKKAYPVLITPLERRCFAEGNQLGVGEHSDYVADLYSMSREKLRKAGAEKTKDWYMHLPKDVYPSHPEGLTDNTHLKYEGAVVYGGCIAAGLKKLGGRYSELLLEA